jgi:tetratricopeptide (TPR) repeat protein
VHRLIFPASRNYSFSYVIDSVSSPHPVPLVISPKCLATRSARASGWGTRIFPILALPLLLAFSSLLSSAQKSAPVVDPLQQHYEAANKFLQSGDQEHAVVEYKAFLAQALHRIANGKADAGEFDAAAPLFEEALTFSPGDRDLQFDYAKACFDADKLVKAKSMAETAANSPGADRAARFLLARVLFHLGEFDPARQLLEKLFAEKQAFNVGYLLAKTYLLLHQEQQTRDLLAGMLANFGDTAEDHVYFGRVYSETDHAQEAIVEFHRAMEIDAHAPDAHYYLGLAYLGHNEAAGYAQAIPEFRAELQINPNDFRSHYMLGYNALKQRNFPDAESELISALASAPRDLQSLLQLAEVYTETNRLPEAEKELRLAISVASENSANEGQAGRAHYQLGRILGKTGRTQEAAQEMKIVAEIQKRLGPSSMQTEDAKKTKEAQDEPKRSGASPEKLAHLAKFIDGLKPPVANAYNNLGAISSDGRDFTTAAAYFQKAIVWDASLPGLDRNLGTALFYSAQYADAVQPLRRRVQTHQDDLPARSMLALSLYKTTDFRGVIEILRPVSAQIGTDRNVTFAYVDSYFQLGKLQLEAGQTDAAIATLEAGKKLNPQNSALHDQLAIAYHRAGREPEAQQEEKTSQQLKGGQTQ